MLHDRRYVDHASRKVKIMQQDKRWSRAGQERNLIEDQKVGYRRGQEMAPATMQAMSIKKVKRQTHLAGQGGILRHTATTQYRKFETNISKKGTARLQSQFLYSYFCERFIYSSDRSAYSAAKKYVGRT
jgi:hypothetical protein